MLNVSEDNDTIATCRCIVQLGSRYCLGVSSAYTPNTVVQRVYSDRGNFTELGRIPSVSIAMLLRAAQCGSRMPTHDCNWHRLLKLALSWVLLPPACASLLTHAAPGACAMLGVVVKRPAAIASGRLSGVANGSGCVGQVRCVRRWSRASVAAWLRE